MMKELLKPKDLSEYDKYAKRFKIVHEPSEDSSNIFYIKYCFRLFFFIPWWRYVTITSKVPMYFSKSNEAKLRNIEEAKYLIREEIQRHFEPRIEEKLTLDIINRDYNQ